MKIQDNSKHYREPIPAKEGTRERDEQQFLDALNQPAPLLPLFDIQGRDSGSNARLFRQPALAGQPQAGIHSQGPVPTISGLVQELTEKIDAGKKQNDIAIRFKSECLPATEVHIVRNAGDLQIAFSTQIASSAAFLRSHQQELVFRLRQKFARERVAVDVVLATEPQPPALGPASVNVVLPTPKS